MYLPWVSIFVCLIAHSNSRCFPGFVWSRVEPFGIFWHRQAQSPESTQPPPSVMSELLPQIWVAQIARDFENGKFLACKIWGGLLRLGRPCIEGVFVQKDSAFRSRAFVVFFLIRLWVCKISHVDYHNLHALPQGKNGKVSQTVPCLIAQSVRSNVQSFVELANKMTIDTRCTKSDWPGARGWRCKLIHVRKMADHCSICSYNQLLFLCDVIDVMYFYI